jgi:hypothetical protein
MKFIFLTSSPTAVPPNKFDGYHCLSHKGTKEAAMILGKPLSFRRNRKTVAIDFNRWRMLFNRGSSQPNGAGYLRSAVRARHGYRDLRRGRPAGRGGATRRPSHPARAEWPFGALRLLKAFGPTATYPNPSKGDSSALTRVDRRYPATQNPSRREGKNDRGPTGLSRAETSPAPHSLSEVSSKTLSKRVKKLFWGYNLTSASKGETKRSTKNVGSPY